MLVLMVGVVLFAGVHLVPSLAPSATSSLQSRLGENGYKGVFSLLLLVAIGMIVLGWRSAHPGYVYSPAAALQLPALLLIFFAFLLFVVSNRRSRAHRWLRHPQLTGVTLWGLAHLLLNGDSRSVVLFGGLTAWALLEIFAINRRDGPWERGDSVPWRQDLVALAITAVAVTLVIAAHPYIAGVPVM